VFLAALQMKAELFFDCIEKRNSAGRIGSSR
jgi:hypothetical protein